MTSFSDPPDAPAGSAAPAGEPGGTGSFPVDPVRLLGGLWKRRRWMVAGLVSGALLGLCLGLFRAKTRYIITVQLIKRDLPSAFRVGELGEAFRPHQLSGGTLVGTAAAVNVLERVAAKSSPPVSVGELKGGIEVKDQRNTDFVFLTLYGRQGKKETADLANLWASEVVQFSRELQSQESREIRQFLQQQVDETDSELRKLNGEILAFSKRENLVDASKQIDAYLHSLSELDLKYESTRIDLETMDFKIKGVETELRRQSPVAEKWRTAKAEVDDLRSRYTDQNPLVIEKLEKMKALEAELKAEESKPQVDLSSFAGTALGNTLYLDLVHYQNEKKALARQEEALAKLRTQERSRLNEIPEKAAAFAQLALKKQSLETARSLLFSRLREAQLFEENAPGYFRVFAPAEAGQVTVKSKISKMAIFTIGLAVFAAMTAMVLALVAELLDPLLRTGWEAAKSIGAPLFATLPAEGGEPLAGAEIWARWIGAAAGDGLPRIIWSPSPGPEEQRFWELLVDKASSLLPQLRVIDCGPPGLPEGARDKIRIERIETGKFSIADARQLGDRARESRQRGEETWIRLCGPVHEPLTTVAKCGQPPLVIVRLNAESNDFWKTQGELLEKTVGRVSGVIATGGVPIFERT